MLLPSSSSTATNVVFTILHVYSEAVVIWTRTEMCKGGIKNSGLLRQTVTRHKYIFLRKVRTDRVIESSRNHK